STLNPKQSSVRTMLGIQLHSIDFLRRQAVEFVDEVVDLPIRRRDLRFERFRLVQRLGGGETLTGGKEQFDKPDKRCALSVMNVPQESQHCQIRSLPGEMALRLSGAISPSAVVV